VSNPKIGTMVTNLVTHGTTNLFSDKPKETIKETTINNEFYGIVNDSKQGNYTYNSEDVPRETQRQVGTEKSYNSGYGQNIHNEQGLGYITNPNVAKETIKETTLLQNYTGVLKNDDSVGGYISNPNQAKETQRQIGVENSNFQTGASAYAKKQQISCPENIQYLGCRDDIYGREEEHAPTQVNMQMIPIKDTHGSVHLKTVVFDDRGFYPSGPTQYVRNNYTNEFTRHTQRDDILTSNN
jgi:hypothetical protein